MRYDPAVVREVSLIKSIYGLKRNMKRIFLEPLKFYGQEILHSTFAIAKMNTFIHDMEAHIALGDTMNRPPYLQRREGRSYPTWLLPIRCGTKIFLPLLMRMTHTIVSFLTILLPVRDWGWIQHMFASLNEKGKMAVVIDTGGSLER